MNILTGLVVGLALFFWSCQSKTDTHSHHDTEQVTTTTVASSVAELETQVLATHDSVMTQMGELMRLKKAVMVQLEKVSDNAGKKQGLVVRDQLDGADRLMMDWMHDYNGDTLKKLDQAKAMTYLKDQQAKVNTVRGAMQKSITDAGRYLD